MRRIPLTVVCCVCCWQTLLVGNQATKYDGATLATRQQKSQQDSQEEFIPLTKKNQLQQKTKVEILGSTLKKYVAALRKTPSKEVELVFLVDSSSSVGYENFYNEIKFVKKLLADFTVSLNTTRVAVVTFSSKDRVTKHLDHISNPSEANHKCKLLEEQINSINYAGGGTYTYGAVIKAQQVLEHSRPNATKAVFLVTDGYSNGEDPRPAAKQLREDYGAEVFTFGIRNGNVRELLEMASEPQHEHSYILDSFEEFEALARRALHEDLHTGGFLRQPPPACDRLCIGRSNNHHSVTSGDCCNPQAECTCGTHTGHYACLCAPGYYGSGIKDDCKPCPEGTYKWTTEPGDATTCLPCPDINQYSPEASTGPHMCTCKKGFASQDGKCKVVQCLMLSAPEHGYLVSGQCGTAYNAACGVRCEPGYKLVGSSIRLCGEDGKWSGEEPHCKMRSCPELLSPRFGSMECSGAPMYDSECRFSCLPGYNLIGSIVRRCLSVALWDGLPVYCRPVTCPPLPLPTNGTLSPVRCSSGRSSYGDTCRYVCADGFTLSGARQRKCQDKGEWSDWPVKKTKCIDVQPPKVSCPQSLVVDAEEDQPSALVSWTPPEPEDNSGEPPTLLVVPAVFPPRRFSIGVNLITYVAEDRNLNVGECNFTITVRDGQAPTVDQCESPGPFLTRSPPANLSWTEPVFSDNSGLQPQVRRSHSPGLFPYGEVTVTYVALDQAGNNSTCLITITVQEHACVPPNEPVNGLSKCVESETRVDCVLECLPGYAFVDLPGHYTCAYDGGKWTPSDAFPDCSETELPNTIVQVGLVSIVPEKKDFGCEDYFLLDQLEKHLKRKLFRMITGICGNSVSCSVEKTHTTCHRNREKLEEETNMIGRRRRRWIEWTSTLGLKVQRHRRSFPIEKVTFINSTQHLPLKERVGLQFHLTGTLNNESRSNLARVVASASHHLESAALTGDLDLNMGSSRFRVEAVYFPDRTLYICEPGRVLKDQHCVKCPVGTFFNVTSEGCESCPLGTYQFQEGQLTCLVCPQRTSTTKGQSKSLEECKAQCLPGSFSPTGLEVCQTCSHGYFQTRYAQTECQPCPSGQTTWRRGSRLPKDCNEVCESGQVSRTGLQPCFACPDGYFQPSQGERVCVRCPGGKPTKQTGAKGRDSCIGEFSFKILSTDSDYDSTVAAFGSGEEILPVNDCFSVPCLNGASCEALDFGYVCNCAPGFKGVHCETEIDECEWLSPCQHGGRCQDEVAGYTCLCTQGYTGKDCEVEVDECAPEPCANGATCVDQLNGFACKCAPGFTGALCHVNINECASKPCLNGGTCRDRVAAFSCTCPSGFTGETCQTNVDDCLSTPCHNNATCVDDINSFSCECPEGFRGTLCEVDIDECASSPCTNGATCRDLVATFLCLCPPAYSGKLCEIELSSDFHLVFSSKDALAMAVMEGLRCDLTSFTLCLWMNTLDRSNYGTPFSYATDLFDNALTLTDYSGFVLSVNQEKRVTDVTANDGTWHQVCATWRSSDGLWTLYKDGQLADTGQGLAKGQTILGDGTLILGQEQDVRGRNFSAQESFVGSLSSVHLWRRHMEAAELSQLYSRCPHRELRGDVLAWPDFLSGLRGQLTKNASLFCQGCPDPPAPANGEVRVVPDNQPNGQAIYSCDLGYEMAGQAVRTCTVHGGWSGTLPKCQRVNCGSAGSILNGFSNGRSTLFGDKVVLACLPGFRLVGEAVRQCQHDGKWTNQLPSCKEILCTLPDSMPQGEIVTKSKKIKFRDQVTLKCNEGYSLDGPERLTCGPEGQWDRDNWPLCQPRSCRSPPLVPHGVLEGEFQGQNFTVGNLVKYRCLEGYALAGNGTIRCGVSRQWAGIVPKCERVSCGPPPQIAQATFTSSQVVPKFGDVVKYSCSLGHELANGSQSDVFCLANGTLSKPFPLCLPISCPELEAPLHGKIQAANFSYNTVVHFSCDPGYDLHGVKARKCRPSRDWSGEEPVCLPLKCPPPRTVANGKYSGQDYTVGNVVLYSCNQGYELIGRADTVCGQDGHWIHDIPMCQPVKCREPPPLAFGRWEASGWTFGHKLDYTCDEGHELVGPSSALCRESKRWEPRELPICRPITCPTPPEVEDGQHNVTETATFGAFARYSCRIGYTMTGQEILKCLASGTWSAPLPVCKVVRCPHPLPIQHAYLVYADTSYKSAVEYYCDDGYKLEGAETRVCGADGKWTKEQPSCQRVKCPQPIPVENGNVVADDVVYGSSATYTCHVGHRPVSGNLIRTCTEAGEWSGTEPLCLPVICPDLASPEHGRLLPEIEGPLQYLTVVEFACDLGWTLEGGTTLECGPKGTWIGEEPTCAKVLCPSPPPAPEHGTVIGTDYSFGNTVEYSCNSGYIMKGSSSIICVEDGTWLNYSQPTCDRRNCGRPAALANGVAEFQGTLLGDRVLYRCFEGFLLEGPDHLTCNVDGQWAGKASPFCRRLTCTSPPVASQNLECEIRDSYKSGENVTCTCTVGHEMDTEETSLLCGLNGQWVLPFPKCSKVSCPVLVDPLFGNLVGNPDFRFESELSFECNEGWTLVGERTLRCEADKKWNTTAPVCVGIKCPVLPTVQNAMTGVDNDTSYGTSVVYNCMPGYYLVGENNLTCRVDNTWSSDSPVCKPVECPTLVNQDKITCSAPNTEFNSEAFCECHLGFRIHGKSVLRCTEHGNWSDPEPTCSRVSCPTPKETENGEIFVETGIKNERTSLLKNMTTFLYQDRIMYTCNVGYDLSGSQTRVCSENGSWSNSDPSCQPVSCGALPEPTNGKVSNNGLYYKSIATYSCDVGYRLEGTSLRECLANGVWSQEEPCCNKVVCPPPRAITSGILLVTSFEYGSQVVYSCLEGFKLHGEAIRMCDALGQWTGEEPKCHQITCSDPGQVYHGIVTYKSVSYGSQARVSCDMGYESVGPVSATCMLNGNWSHSFQNCTPVSCSSPVNVSNGYILGGYWHYGVSISYECEEGFQLKGQSTSVCQANRKWSNESPECDPVECPAIPVPRNGLLYGAERRTFRNHVKIVCDDGYNLVGLSGLFCTANRTWSGPVPICQVASCPPITNISHGFVVGRAYTYRSELKFECDHKFKLLGAKTIRCTAGGRWTEKPPTCLRHYCDEVPPILNAIVSRGRHVLGTKLTVECETGFFLEGVGRIICNKTGQWQTKNLTCVAITCFSPPRIDRNGYDNRTEDGLYTYQMFKEGNLLDIYDHDARTYRYGYVLEYLCHNGYELQGNNVSRCELNGRWSSPTAPKCVHRCSPPPILSNATATIIREGQARLAVEYTCDKGFFLVGSKRHTCSDSPPFWNLNGTWCELVECGRPPVVPMASYYELVSSASPGRWHWRSQISYRCLAGHRLISGGTEVATLTCSDQGRWSGPPLPRCLPVACPDPTRGHSTALITEPTEPVYGSQVHYSCRIGFKLVGDAVRQCEATGQWSGKEPKCIRTQCFIEETPANSQMTVLSRAERSHWSVGDTLSFECSDGFTLNGEKTLTCQNSGFWNASFPTCSAQWCSGPKLPPGSVAFGSNRVNSRMLIRCPPGQRVIGQLMITCLPSGHWDGQPACEGICTYPCQNGGTCLGGLLGCKCPDGYTGNTCENPICILPCLNGGTCIAPYTCSCRAHYTGSRCQTPSCQPACQNMGICYKPNRCRCPWSYSGHFCQHRVTSRKR